MPRVSRAMTADRKQWTCDMCCQKATPKKALKEEWERHASSRGPITICLSCQLKIRKMVALHRFGTFELDEIVKTKERTT